MKNAMVTNKNKIHKDRNTLPCMATFASWAFVEEAAGSYSLSILINVYVNE